MSIAEEIRVLTWDAGARRLGEIVDALQAKLDNLQQQVDACCGSSLQKIPQATTAEAPKTEP